MSELIVKAYRNIYPNKEFLWNPVLKYMGNFSAYNGNIRSNHFTRLLEVRMSKEWKEVSEEIQLGLIEHLLAKLFNKKITTSNMDLYENFIKNLSKANALFNDEEDVEDEQLLDSFNRVNDEYFSGMMAIPKIEWGKESFNRLGTYEYAIDTIRLSTVLKKDQDLLDYVLYHELLHKKLLFQTKNGRTTHHSKEFRDLEKQFKIKDIEERLEAFLKKQKKKNFLKFF